VFQSIHHVTNHVVVTTISAFTNTGVYFDVAVSKSPTFIHHLVKVRPQVMFPGAGTIIHRISAPVVDFVYEQLTVFGIYCVDFFYDFFGIHGVKVARIDFPFSNFMFIVKVEVIEFAPQLACDFVFHFAHHTSRPLFF